MKLIYLILAFIIQTSAFGSSKEPIGIVQSVMGKGYVLQKPLKTKKNKSSKMKLKKASKISYEGFTWRVSSLSIGDKIHMGDVILTGSKSSLVIAYYKGYTLKYGGNTSVHTIPDAQASSEPDHRQPHLILNHGIMRLFSSSDKTKPLNISTSSISFETFNSDLVLSSQGKKAQLFNLSGLVNSNKLSNKGRNFLSSATNTFRQNKQKAFNSNARAFAQNRKKQQKTKVLPSQKIYLLDNIDSSEVNSLFRLLGRKQAKAYIAGGQGFTTFPIYLKDIAEIKEYIPDLDKLEIDIENQYLDIEDQLADYDEKSEGEEMDEDTETVQDIKVTGSYKGYQNSIHRLFAFRLGASGIQSLINADHSITGKGPSLEVEIRAIKPIYFSLNVSKGQWNAKKLEDYLGKNSPEVTSSDYSQLSAGLGVRLTFWDMSALSLGIAAVDNTPMVIRYDDSPGNVNRNYSIDYQTLPIVEAGFTSKIYNSLEIYASYGQGQTKSIVQTEDISITYRPVANIKIGKVGLSWTTD